MPFALFFFIRRAMGPAALGALALVLSACAAASRPTPMSLTPTAPPPSAEATVTLPPSTAVVPSTPTAAAPDWTDFESRTPDGLYERGNPDAPVLIRDYSDFL
jgi:hypothetical protein